MLNAWLKVRKIVDIWTPDLPSLSLPLPRSLYIHGLSPDPCPDWMCLFVSYLQSQGWVWTPDFFSAHTERTASGPQRDIHWIWHKVYRIRITDSTLKVHLGKTTSTFTIHPAIHFLIVWRLVGWLKPGRETGYYLESLTILFKSKYFIFQTSESVFLNSLYVGVNI